MENLGSAGTSFLLIQITIMLGGLLTWAFWQADQTRKRLQTERQIAEIRNRPRR